MCLHRIDISCIIGNRCGFFFCKQSQVGHRKKQQIVLKLRGKPYYLKAQRKFFCGGHRAPLDGTTQILSE